MRKVIATAPASCELVVSRSRFLGFLRPIDSDTAARSRISEIASDYHDASHVVFAYVLGEEHEVFSFSDAGEPHGTAGRPILEVLRHGELINVLVCIVRYFGGTKLGTGGLSRAYADACKELINVVPVREFVNERAFSISVLYEIYEPTKRLIEASGGRIESEVFGTRVDIRLVLDVRVVQNVSRQLAELSRGEIGLVERDKNGVT